ncbi:MAG: hypothetical protein ACP5I1_13695 [Candidatus Hinthialibacter sp.]
MAEVPIDPHYADMLPSIQAGLDSLFHGDNPYRAYHDIASWEIRFVYGPGLWGPFILPYLAGVDLRLMTLLCGMAIPAVILMYAILWAGVYHDGPLALLMIITSFVICNNYAFIMFFPVAHTFVYWPFFLLFCLAIQTKRLWTATILLGWLLLCRTTMISIAPVYFIFLFKTQRKTIFQHAGLFLLTVILPMLPFIVWDYQSLLDNMILNYTTVIKAYAWNTPDVINISFGLTPLLVQLHLERCAFFAQVAILLLFYIILFRIHDADQWLMCMPYALLLFSFTTIWPVMYLFLDVFIFLTAIIAAKIMASVYNVRRIQP